jgi:hypothetical protein
MLALPPGLRHGLRIRLLSCLLRCLGLLRLLHSQCRSGLLTRPLECRRLGEAKQPIGQDD